MCSPFNRSWDAHFCRKTRRLGRITSLSLNYSLWQRRFGSDPNIIGQIIRLDASPYTVIGVLPQSFDFSIPEYFDSRDLWVPSVLPFSTIPGAATNTLALSRVSNQKLRSVELKTDERDQ